MHAYNKKVTSRKTTCDLLKIISLTMKKKKIPVSHFHLYIYVYIHAYGHCILIDNDIFTITSVGNVFTNVNRLYFLYLLCGFLVAL